MYKWIRLWFLVLAGVLFTSSVVFGTTYYIRPDGGTGEQCTGTVDAPYPGSGVNQPCGFSHPFWLLDSGGKWKIQGGDTVVIYAGSYMIGYGAPNTSGWCDSSYTYDCVLPPLPSGPSAANPTRILGVGWDAGCPSPPELWGTERVWQVMDLTGSSNIYIACLDITDHSSCVEGHSNSSVECERNTYPHGEWAAIGIEASDSSNVTLKDLDIHGLASTGVHAGRLTDWTIEDVRIAGNGFVGWDGDLWDGSDSNSGTIWFKGVTIEWNGCGETYPGKQPHNCWAQTAGGYGDGLGTGNTAGHWIFTDCIFRYNTSDGLDLLYARTGGSQIDIKRTMAYGNAGNAIKVNGPASIENSLIVGDCGFFEGKSFTYHVDNCRAGGAALSMSLRDGITVSAVNNTIAGQGDCVMTVECDSTCSGSETVTVQNNIFYGYAEFGNQSDTACYVWFDNFNYYNTQFDYNLVYGVKMGGMTLSANDLNQDPKVVNNNINSFDGHLQAGSPAIDSGLAVGSLSGLVPSGDLDGNSRPSGSGVDRGAYEYASGGSGGRAEIQLNRLRLVFGAVGGTGTGSQEIWISNSGSGTLNWSASPGEGWISVSPSSGSGSGVIDVSVNASGLPAGNYTGTVTVSGGNASNSPQTVAVYLTVYGSGGTDPPFGTFELPKSGETVSSSIAVTGWALDDTGVAGVKIYVWYSGDWLFIDNAVFIEGARLDVEQAYSTYPKNYKAGWGYMMLTNYLPGGGNGSYTLRAAATDLEGYTTTLGTKTITVDNVNVVKPFGAIDTPKQGGTASGSGFVNWGWVLTPRPNKIPVDGSTINVFVDGVNVGNPVYNLPRPDVAAYFPGYANTDGASGYFTLDTTAYDNGVYSIEWVATDNGGNRDGIGSRYFIIQNTGSNRVRELRSIGAAFKGLPRLRLKNSGAVRLRRGFDDALPAVLVEPDGDGIIRVEMKRRERVVIYLDEGDVMDSTAALDKGRYFGFLEGFDGLRRLPIGSTLDRERGVFYWLPGPGFLGEFRLVFYREEGGVLEKRTVVVSLE